MKCNRLAVYGWKQKRSIGKSKSYILGSCDTLNRITEYENQIGELFDMFETCNGEIESQVELEYIPYFGGSDANIEVRFRCKKCGYEYAGENGLPYDVDSLNKYLTEIIKERN